LNRPKDKQLFGKIVFEDFQSYLSKKNGVIIVDEKVASLYAPFFSNSLLKLKKTTESTEKKIIKIPSGESEKSFEGAMNLCDQLLELGVDRKTTLIAVGGGKLTDLVGFVASIYMRGVSLILMPTTLLAMVDASIGGKNGINTSYGKNLVGTFYLPEEIVIDLNFLKTLSEKEIFQGQVEMLKLGAVRKKGLFDNLDPMEAIYTKLEVVNEDPTDRGLRKILNYGHTIGHALERGSKYSLSHGEAVAIGCVVEAHLSNQLQRLDQRSFKEIEEKFSKYPLKLFENYRRKEVLEALLYDKKNEDGKVHFVLLDEIGKAFSFNGAYSHPVSIEDLEKSLEWMEKRYG
jgi:3-dehydroquinate synthase